MEDTEKWYFRALAVGAVLAVIGLLLGDAEGASWIVGIGVGLILIGVCGTWAFRSSRHLSRLGTVAVVGLGLIAGVAVSIPGDGDAATDSSEMSEGEASVVETDALAPPSTSRTINGLPVEPPEAGWFDRYDPALGIAEHGAFGWGSTQPDNMRLIHLGTSDAPLSPERRALLGEQLQRARDAALKIGTVGGAKAAGYTRVTKTPSDGRIEYVNFAYQDKAFDIDHPAMMVFQDDSHDDAPVIAVAYGITGTYEEGPPTDLPLEAIPWHFHGPLCMDDEGNLIADMHTFLVDEATFIDGKPADCAAHGGTVRDDLTAWMVDLWVVPGWENPWGLISSKHPDLYPKPWSDK